MICCCVMVVFVFWKLLCEPAMLLCVCLFALFGYMLMNAVMLCYIAVVCLVWSSDGDHECVIGRINHVAVVAQNLHEVCVVVCC